MKVTGKTPAAGNTKDVEIIAPLKYLNNFWRTLEMPLINCEVNLILTWSPTYVISSVTGEAKFKTNETELYVPAVTLSTQDIAKLLQQVKSCFKTTNWNKYAQNRYLNHLINPSFLRVNRLFVLSFKNEDGRTSEVLCIPFLLFSKTCPLSSNPHTIHYSTTEWQMEYTYIIGLSFAH